MRNLARLFSFALLATSLANHAQASSVQLSLQALDGGFLVVHARIGGQEGTFLFDSGSGVSNITPEFAARIGCKPWGQITGLRMTGERLDMKKCDNVSMQVGAFQAKPGTAGVFDLARVLPPSMKGIDGTIALDLFDKQSLRLSYSHRLITIYDRASLAKATAKQKPMPFHIVRDAEGLALTVNLPVTTPDGMAWFETDSGNTSSWVIVGKHLAAYFQLNADDRRPQPISLHLADGVPFTGRAQVLNTILDGNLGTSFLEKYDVILDLVHSRAWVLPVQP